MENVKELFEYISERHCNDQAVINALISLKQVNIKKKFAGLTIREFVTLELLYTNKNSNQDKINIMPSDIANIFHLSMPQISRLINSLEENNYITRVTGNKDRRNIYIYITDKGIDARNTADAESKQYMNTVKEKMGEEDMEQLVVLIRKLTGIMKGA